MNFSNKDIHGDPETARMNHNELLIQQFANQERRQRNADEKLNNELELLTQINDSLEQATQKKQHIIYK